MLGKLHDNSSIFLRVNCGTAADGDGVNYDLSTNASSGTPIIYSSKTGNSMTFSWQALLEYAIEHGINNVIVP
jgi:hypothetical protein